ncbi:uncharacterized protein [Solanum lycopersicum]|uniref:uncharacterized protein n=1 Tax=Solanum lycopersicum TaxID=4081 RepID=UPI0037492188
MPTESSTSGAVQGGTTMVDSHHPLFLQSRDTPGSSLVSIQLTGSENYSLWSRSMKIGLLGKGKIGFIDGKCSKDKFNSSLHDLWEKCNAIVLSWIMISVSRELLSGIVYASSAQQVWTDLRERFDKVDGSRIFYLHKEIATLQQGLVSVSSYFSRLKELWMEYDSLMPCPGCACESSKAYVEHFEYQRQMQFLLGLNESYNQSKSQIMMLDPAPGVNKAYSLIMAEESQRILGKSSTTGSDNSVSANVGGINETMTFFSNGKGHMLRSGSTSQSVSNPPMGASFRSNQKQFNGNNSLYCDYCNWKGHVRANCYKLHGYPADWKGKRRNNTAFVSANHVGFDNTPGLPMHNQNTTNEPCSSKVQPTVSSGVLSQQQ